MQSAMTLRCKITNFTEVGQVHSERMLVEGLTTLKAWKKLIDGLETKERDGIAQNIVENKSGLWHGPTPITTKQAVAYTLENAHLNAEITAEDQEKLKNIFAESNQSASLLSSTFNLLFGGDTSEVQQVVAEERSGIPALDAKIKGHVEKVMQEKPELLLADVMEAVKEKFDISALAQEQVTVIGAVLLSNSLIKDMLEDSVAFAVSKIFAGVMFHYRVNKGTDITLEDINSIFTDPGSFKDVNFSFPTLALAPDGVPQMENGWPCPFTSANGDHYVTKRVAGCSTFPKTTLDPNLGKACGWYVPISVRVQDNMVEAISKISDLSAIGTVYKLIITTTAGQETVGFYFTPTDGWNGKYMGPIGFNDAAEGAGALFSALNPFYAEFKKTHPSLCACFDHRASKMIYEGKVLKVLIHRNMEMLTISPKPKENEVTAAPCGGVQCHVTLSGKSELAKFCMASNGMIYPIPCNPFAKASDGTAGWVESFTKDRKVPMAFYTDAHIGEQSKNSLALAKMYPEAWAVYEEVRSSAKYITYCKEKYILQEGSATATDRKRYTS